MRYNILTENQRNFIISESPNESTINIYINLIQQNKINLVINLTEYDILYDINIIKNANIDYLHFPIEDGNIISNDKLKNLIHFLYKYNSIAFHCMAGFGRAPLICAITFIILFNYKPYDIIKKIRDKEAKAFNNNQLKYLFHFQRNKYIYSSSKCTIC